MTPPKLSPAGAFNVSVAPFKLMLPVLETAATVSLKPFKFSVPPVSIWAMFPSGITSEAPRRSVLSRPTRATPDQLFAGLLIVMMLPVPLFLAIRKPPVPVICELMVAEVETPATTPVKMLVDPAVWVKFSTPPVNVGPFTALPSSNPIWLTLIVPETVTVYEPVAVMPAANRPLPLLDHVVAAPVPAGVAFQFVVAASQVPLGVVPPPRRP